MKRRLLVGATGFGTLWLAGSLALGLPPDDFAQDYAMARAVRAGANAYVEISQLTARYLGFHPEPSWVSSHPPSQVAFMLPFSYLPFTAARSMWFLVSMVALVALVALAYRIVGRSASLRAVGIAALASLSWYPVRRELDLGSTLLLVSLCCAGAMVAYRSGRQGLAGALIGLTFWTRAVCWPVMLVFLARRSWRALGAGLGVGLAGAGLGVVAVGATETARYLGTVLPNNTSFFVGDPSNVSLAGTVARVFQGTGQSPFGGVNISSPLRLPGFTLPVTVAIATMLAIWVTVIAGRLTADAALGTAVCVGVLVGPLTWNFYLVMIGIPALLLLAQPEQSRGVRISVLCGLLPTFLFFDHWESMASSYPVAVIAPLVGLVAIGPVLFGLARVRVP
jgi:alpha-1,2-mannosyltransferase